MKTEDIHDCGKNPANIPRLFRDFEHLEEVVQLVLSNSNIDKGKESEVRLVAQCNDFGMLSNSLDGELNGYSNDLLVETLKSYFTKHQK